MKSVPMAAAPPAMAMPIYPSVLGFNEISTMPHEERVKGHTTLDCLVDKCVERQCLQVGRFPL